MTQELWRCGPFDFDLRDEPVIMGILNVTPDSFSDGGEHNALPDALAWAEKMRGDGARIIDVGGESTRPGATEVPLEEERSRVIPVVKALAKEGFCVSVDTSRPEIMLEAAEAGAAILNDVRAFERPGALEAAASTKLGLVIMHQGPFDPEKDVVEDAFRYLGRREEALLAAGVESERIAWDPDFGFGKTLEQNFEVLAASGRFLASGRPLLAALSRKGSLGRITGRKNPHERAAASVAGALLAAERGARILRVHDVRETSDALAVLKAFGQADIRIDARGRS